MWRRVVPVFLCGLAVLGCSGRTDGPPDRGLVVAPDMSDRRAQFVEHELTADVSHLTDLPVDVDPSYPLEGLQ